MGFHFIEIIWKVKYVPFSAFRTHHLSLSLFLSVTDLHRRATTPCPLRSSLTPPLLTKVTSFRSHPSQPPMVTIEPHTPHLSLSPFLFVMDLHCCSHHALFSHYSQRHCYQSHHLHATIEPCLMLTLLVPLISFCLSSSLPWISITMATTPYPFRPSLTTSPLPKILLPLLFCSFD